jgi:hypothetical protein
MTLHSAPLTPLLTIPLPPPFPAPLNHRMRSFHVGMVMRDFPALEKALYEVSDPYR